MSLILSKPKVLAVGGAGIKIATRLKEAFLSDFDILGIDLTKTDAPFEVLPMGGDMLQFLGSGGDPEVTLRNAEEKKPELEAKLQGASLVFIIAGLGGGTASALAPMVAACAQKAGALTVAFVSLPFGIEGQRRTTQAREALSLLRSSASMVVTLPNDHLLRSAPSGSTAVDAMTLADRNIGRGIRGITGMIYTPGLIEIDFENLKRVIGQAKNVKTLFALGEGLGSQATSQVFTELTACPLLQSGEMARSADHLVLSLKISNDISLTDINQLTTQLCEKFGIRGDRVVGAILESSWTETRIEAVFIGQPDPEARKKQTIAIQAATSSKSHKTKASDKNDSQIEFGFNAMADHRGFFDNTEPNMYRGEDVDVPTYLRRGVKIVL